MSTETWSRTKLEYAYAWHDGQLLRSRYPLYCPRSVTSHRGDSSGQGSNPFSVISTKVHFDTPGEYISTSTGKKWSGPSIALVGLVDLYSGGYPASSYHDETASVKAHALQKLFANASEPYFREIHQFGELAETVAALKSPLGGIRKLGGKLSDIWKKPGKAKLPIKDAAGAYLEHIFGTVPMFDQAATLGDAAARALDKSFPTQVIHRAGAEEVVSTTDDTQFHVYINGYTRPIFEHCYCYYTHKSEVKARAGAGMLVKNPKLRNSFNPAGLAAEGWELLPLSFLANMFVDVASMLKECRPVPGTIADTWVTTVCTTTDTYTLDSVSGCSTQQAGVFRVVRSMVNRYTDISRTGKLYLGPGLNSLGKLLSTAALGISRFT